MSPTSYEPSGIVISASSLAKFVVSIRSRSVSCDKSQKSSELVIAVTQIYIENVVRMVLFPRKRHNGKRSTSIEIS